MQAKWALFRELLLTQKPIDRHPLWCLGVVDLHSIQFLGYPSRKKLKMECIEFISFTDIFGTPQQDQLSSDSASLRIINTEKTKITFQPGAWLFRVSWFLQSQKGCRVNGSAQLSSALRTLIFGHLPHSPEMNSVQYPDNAFDYDWYVLLAIGICQLLCNTPTNRH